MLLCFLVAQMLASPLADSYPHVGALLAILLLASLAAGARYVANRTRDRLVGIPIAAIWLVTRMLEALASNQHVYAHLSPIAGLALSCAILWAILDRFDSMPRV